MYLRVDAGICVRTRVLAAGTKATWGRRWWGVKRRLGAAEVRMHRKLHVIRERERQADSDN